MRSCGPCPATSSPATSAGGWGRWPSVGGSTSRGWLDALDRLEGTGTLVRDDDLDERFPAEVQRLAAILDRPIPAEIRRPALDEAMIHPGEGGSGKFRKALRQSDLDFVSDETGETMLRLRYSFD